MWRLAVRQLTRCHQQQLDPSKGTKLGSRESGAWAINYRFKISVAAAAAQVTAGYNGELVGVDVGWDLRPASALPYCAPMALSCPAPNPLEESVTALDAALHSVVNLPWLANHMWWMQLLSDCRTDGQEQYRNSRSGTQTAFRNSFGAKSFGSSAAAIEDGVEEACNAGEDFDQKQQKEKLERMKKERRRHSKLRSRQIKIETLAWQAAAAEYRELLSEMCKKNLAPNLPVVQSLLLGWFEPFKNAIAAEQKAVVDLEFKEHRAGYGPYITQLPADMLAVIAMHKLIGLLMADFNAGGFVKIVSAASVIGEAVESEVGIYKFMKKQGRKKKKKKTNKSVDEEDTSTSTKLSQGGSDTKGELQDKVSLLLRRQHLRLARTLVRHANGDEPWSNEIRVKVGAILIEILLDKAFVQSPASQAGEEHVELRPAFKRSVKVFPGGSVFRQFGAIECDPLILKHLDQSVKHMVMPYMPMLVNPVNWTGFNRGGHLVLPTFVMRIHGALPQREAIEKSSTTSMKKVFEALDFLGSIPWRINRRVLDVVETIWADGGRIAEMVDVENVPVSKKPMAGDEVALKNWRREAAKARHINNERHSIRCATELKLNVARKLKEEEGFYYPHNLDFRGRAYPVHPHLNHLGSDMCRGVLEFAEGRPLGPNGFRWLKVHIANVFAGGVDKLSFDDRAAFVDTNLDEVFDSAEKPLHGRRWWLQAEDPFQCLAACMDIRDALLADNTETFISHLPVHQDGSCNGLQHYAALGRDQNGAESVNLTTGDKPADVYSGIAVRVRAVIEKDAADDPIKNPNAEKAKLLLSQIDRKFVKQTVMTSVYGVTFIGARNQILARLKERGLGDDVSIFHASCYAARVTINALGQMFKEARCIMNWLGDCAKIIACEGDPVRWTTPMNLPVVQPYRKPGRKLVKTSLQVLALRVIGNQPVAVSRQRTAFPPNFVHSLDGSHMMMTALSCSRENLHFAGVHDSFWTHAGSVERMNHLLRRTFVELYSEPILENLLEGFKKDYPRLDFPDIPVRGDLDLSEVLSAPYFFN